MFVDKEKNQPENQPSSDQQPEEDNMRNMLIFGGVVAALLVFILAAFFLMTQMNGEEGGAQKDKKEATTTEEKDRLGGGTLPGEAGESTTTEEKKLREMEAEKLSFGQFYEEKPTLSTSSLSGYELPLNVKTDVANYHDVARKVDLDKKIGYLNNYGFATVDNPFSKEENNFYNVYRRLGREGLAPLITSDFLLYYYQNTLKKDFKKIEHNIFYDNLWDINKRLYQTAKSRYQNRRREVGMTNAPLLEAERLETVFFATALKLLEPIEEQVAAKGEQTKKEEKFSPQEAEKFSIDLPSYLRDQVKEEVELIREGGGEYDSPVLLYKRNYKKDFQVPEQYKDTARLNNFYLTTQWLNSPFPLYYKGSKCPNCLLDKEDWRINMIAAFLLSEDFNNNQLLQNKWARIYKLVSFFKGLRSDLTYLDYAKTLKKELGKDKNLDKAFSSYKKADKSLGKLQKELSQYEFSGMAGGYNTADTSTIPKQGLKVMTESYWPNDYIFKKLTYPNVSLYKESGHPQRKKKDNVTLCELDGNPYRCRGFGLDVINLIHSIPENNEYFVENTNYAYYSQQASSLKKELKDFSDYRWHGSNYWSLLYTLNKYISDAEIEKPPFAGTKAWRRRKLDASLGAWTNLQLDKDTWGPYQKESRGGSFNEAAGAGINKYAYVEPNLSLTNELLSHSEMLLKMFNSLRVTNEAASVKTDMKRMIERLSKIRGIVKRELSGKSLSKEDYKFLHKFLRQYKVVEKGNKIKMIGFGDAAGRMVESINGVELLVVAHQKGDKIFFSVGPVFDYKEEFQR